MSRRTMSAESALELVRRLRDIAVDHHSRHGTIVNVLSVLALINDPTKAGLQRQQSISAFGGTDPIDDLPQGR